jgi:hypothetical protein
LSVPVLSWPVFVKGWRTAGSKPPNSSTTTSKCHPAAPDDQSEPCCPEQASDIPAPRLPTLGPQSQSFFQRYRSSLPTSLTRLILSTRGCEPRRPDAVSGTARKRTKYLLGFHRPMKTHRSLSRSQGLYLPFVLFSGQADSKESRS